MQVKPQYWFPAKTYGWGWGLPTRWQGWVVLGVYAALIFAGAVLFRPRLHPLAFVLYVTVLSLVLIAICLRTGEPPRWRWGK